RHRLGQQHRGQYCWQWPGSVACDLCPGAGTECSAPRKLQRHSDRNGELVMPCWAHSLVVTHLLCLTVLAMGALSAHGDTGINDQIVSQSFQLRAEIVPGCLLGAGGSDATSFGNISFGQVSTLPSNLDAASTPDNGSIV